MERFYGKYRGKVIENVDPFLMGRLMILVPSVTGETQNWAMPCVPYAGPEVGFLALPPVGANVWIEYEAGNIDYPIWAGCFWSKGEAPPIAVSPEIKFWKTQGSTMMFNDTPGEGGFTLEVGPPTIEAPMTIQINATGITLTNLPSIVKLTEAGIQSICGEASIDITEASITMETEPSTINITPAAINLANGSGNIDITEASIVINLDAGMITVTPETILMNEGALTVV